MKIMKTKTKVELAAAVGAGYLLGRTHQLKMAVKLAGAGGRSPGGPQDLLTQGSELLASSPDIAELGDSAERAAEWEGRIAAAVKTEADVAERIDDAIRQRLGR